MKDAIIYREIPSVPGYYAGSDGSVLRARVLKQSMGTNGRPQITPVVNSTAGTKYVHALVCEAFHGKRPEGMVASHKNGNKLDNRPENLTWETQSENLARRKGHGTSDDGVRNTRACLTEEDVQKIHSMRINEHQTQREIADSMAISRTTVSRVLNGKRYV